MSTTTTTTTGTTTPIPGQVLKKEFTTYWGDSFNGLFVKWQHDVRDTSSLPSMTMQLTANLYAAAKDNFLFGQTRFPTTADDAARTLSKIAPSPGGSGGASWNYCDGALVVPSYTHVNFNPPTTLDTDTNDAFLDPSCPPNYTAQTKRGPGAPLDATKMA